MTIDINNTRQRMDRMTLEQKTEALNALAEISIKFRKPGDWYVQQSVEIKDGPVLRGMYGNGSTPEQAIENHWANLVENIGSLYLVVNAGSEQRRAVRWNGYMWWDYPEPKAVAAA